MTSTLLAATLKRDDHSRSFEVFAALSGWDATERIDQSVVQRQHYTDWHRVERALARFSRTIDALHEAGWREA